MMRSWKYIGALKSGECVYQSNKGDLSVEKDWSKLVEPTPQEKGEIYRSFPQLVSEVKHG